jgi:hypothetical protein
MFDVPFAKRDVVERELLAAPGRLADEPIHVRARTCACSPSPTDADVACLTTSLVEIALSVGAQRARVGALQSVSGFERDAKLDRDVALEFEQLASRDLLLKLDALRALGFQLRCLTVKSRDRSLDLALARVFQLVQSPLGGGSLRLCFARALLSFAP